MSQKIASLEVRQNAYFLVGRTLACMVLLIWCSAVLAQNSSEAKSQAGATSIRATHVMGFEGVVNNATGNLSIEASTLKFRKDNGSGEQIDISSIQDVLVGEEDKQVGGVPMALGRAATPFGGGRVIGLFSHKKYDTLTLEYVDSNGGFHGAIFQINKGQAQLLKNELVTNGAHVTRAEDQPVNQSASEVKNESK